MMQTIGSTSQDRNEKLPYLDLARALVADAMRHHDTRWLNSYMGTFCMDMIGYKPSVKAKIEEITANQKHSTKSSHLWLWKGQYLTIKEIAKREGINPQTLANRISTGWDLNTAVKRATDLKINTTLYSWKGQMLTLMQIARQEGVNYQRLYMRVYRGWSLERAVAAPACEPNGRRESCFFS